MWTPLENLCRYCSAPLRGISESEQVGLFKHLGCCCFPQGQKEKVSLFQDCGSTGTVVISARAHHVEILSLLWVVCVCVASSRYTMGAGVVRWFRIGDGDTFLFHLCWRCT